MNSYLFKIIMFLKIMVFLFVLFCFMGNLETTLVSGELAAWPLFYI